MTGKTSLGRDLCWAWQRHSDFLILSPSSHTFTSPALARETVGSDRGWTRSETEAGPSLHSRGFLSLSEQACKRAGGSRSGCGRRSEVSWSSSGGAELQRKRSTPAFGTATSSDANTAPALIYTTTTTALKWVMFIHSWSAFCFFMLVTGYFVSCLVWWWAGRKSGELSVFSQPIRAWLFWVLR